MHTTVTGTMEMLHMQRLSDCHARNDSHTDAHTTIITLAHNNCRYYKDVAPTVIIKLLHTKDRMVL